MGVRSVYIFDQEGWLNSKAPQKAVLECDSEAVILGGRDLFRGDLVFKLDPKAGTESLVHSHQTANFKESLESMRSTEPFSEVKEKLAMDYLASLDIVDLCKQFGFNEKERQALSTYHVVEKLSPVNPRKTKEENNTFSFQIEGNYCSDKPYTLYVSKDQLLEFASRQQIIEQQKEQESTFSPYQ
ncbi:hypothetical protein [Legionella waltersii]|uniref:Uncharacterized protein n=1 Tax=Legionella waltersii TaxID=66969 RepID=A0A0W1A100_9GAMM|nr:hypothetical protein [Legionella waltersii]KTD74816.1 hypothetical protein Lwal_2857 [Legionella waltersii]SNV11582.1 Uncharacterised protein [Legionella waltersii]